MATRAEYKKQGYTDAQINKAIASSGMGGAPVDVKSANAKVATPAKPAPTTPVPSTPAPVTPKPVATVTPKTPPASSAPVVPPAPVAKMSPDAETPAMRVGTTTAPQATTQPAPVSQPPVSPDNVTPADAAIASVAQTQEKPVVTTPKPVKTTAKKETVKIGATETPKNYDVSTGREQEIQSNLTRISAENPALLTDRAKFDQAFGYATADAGKKALLDSFFDSSVKRSSNDYFALLASNSPFDPKLRTDPQFQSAKARFDSISGLKWATTTTLFDAMVNGTLNPSSQRYQDLVLANWGVETPEMKEAKIKYDKKKKVDAINNGMNVVNGSKTPTTPTGDEISSDIVSTKWIDYAEQFKKDIVNNPDLLKQNEELNAVNLEIKTLEDQKKATFDEFIAAHPGVSTGAALLWASKENEAVDKRLNQLYDKQSVGSANLKYQTDLAMKAFDYKVQAEQDAQKFQQQKDLAKFQSDLALSSKQREFEQQVAQKAAIASDPVLATQDLLDTYAKIGILPQRSSAEIIADIKSQIAGGKTLGQALTDLNKAFQSKPEYVALKTKPETTTQDWTKLTDDTLYNQRTGEVKPAIIGAVTGDLSSMASQYPGQAWAKNNNPTGIKTTINSNTKRLLQEAWIQWTEWSKPPSGETGTYMKFATIEDGMKAYQVLLTQAGTQDVYARLKQWVGTAQWDNYASSIMKEAGLNPNQSISFSSLSESQLNQLMSAQLKRESRGLYDLMQKKSTTTEKPVSSEAKYWVDAWNNGAMDLDTILTKIGSSKEALPLKNDVIKQISTQGWVAWRKEDDPMVKQVKSLRDSVSDLLKKENSDYLDDVSGGFQFSPWDSLTKNKQDYLGKVQFVLESKTLQNLIDAKAQGATFGALSEAELKMLQSSASVLTNRAIKDENGNITGFNMSEKAFKKELENLNKLYSDNVSRMTWKGIPGIEMKATPVVSANSSDEEILNYLKQ